MNTPEALKGLSFLTDSFKDGTIPKAAITWQEEQSRTAFQNGELIFLRNWAYVYRLARPTDHPRLPESSRSPRCLASTVPACKTPRTVPCKVSSLPEAALSGLQSKLESLSQ